MIILAKSLLFQETEKRIACLVYVLSEFYKVIKFYSYEI
jgi:hypothetical protein